MISSPLKQIAENTDVAFKLDYFIFNIYINENASLIDSLLVRSDNKILVFATDNFGGEFAFMDSPEGHIVYITPDGRTGKIATDLENFFELVIYYPYWRELLKEKYADDQDELDDKIIKAENELSEAAFHEGEDLQEEIFKMAQLLGIRHSVDILDNFYSCLSENVHKGIFLIAQDEACKALLQD